MPEILVGGQQGQVVPNAQSREQSIDRSNLDAAAPAVIPQRCRFDVVLAVRLEQWQRGKAVQDCVAVLRAGKALHQFLQHQAGCRDGFTDLQSPNQSLQRRRGWRLISPQGERPDAGIDE